MNTKNVHVIREPTITKIVMLFSILMCILLYKPITAEATSADCDKGYGIPSPSTMVDLATGKGAYWSSGGSWQSWIDFYKSMGYTYTGYSDCYMLYGANSSGHSINEYVHGYWMDLTKNGQTYWAILRNDFGDTNTYYSRYNGWHCVNETLNGVNEYTWYYTNGIGIVYTNTWLHTRTHDPHPNKSDIHGYFCFNASGRMSVGWHKGTDGKWYYFRIDTVRGEDGANTRTGMSEHGGLIWNTVHSPTTYGANSLYSEGLYSLEGLDVATNVYRRNTNGTFDYVGTDVTRINAGSNSNQIEPFRSKKISSNTKYVNDQIYNTNALYINTDVAGTYTADQNVLLVNDDYQHIRVNEYTYYIDRKKFTLTQNINSDTETTKTSTIYYEGTQNIPTPTKKGYKFDGWEVSGNGSKMDGNTFTMGDADATITAKWTPIDYTISYDLQGGAINGQPTKYTIESPTLNIPRPIKTGYTFLGWTGSNGNTNQLDVSIAHGSTGNKAYTAHWSANIYEIKLDSKLEGCAGSTGTTVIYEKYDTGFYSDKACTKQITSITIPHKIGNAFNGYTDNRNIIIDSNGAIKVKTNYFLQNTTLSAKWTLNTYRVIFNGNRNSSGKTDTLVYTWSNSDTNNKALTPNGYIRTGWNYINWNTINNGKGTAYNNNQMIGNKFFIDNLGKDVLLDGKSHDVTLYAQWKDITVPDIKEVTAEQETLLSKVNSGQLTLTSQSGAYNGELYTNLKIKIDENNANKDASGIKNVSVLVYDKNNTTVQKTYDITNNISYGTNTKYDFGYDGKYYPYSGTYTFKVNLYKEFPNTSKLGIYVYCTDAQGNITKRNDIFTRPSVDIPQDKPIVIPDKPIEGIVIDEINECIYSQYVTVEGSKDFGVGETGITTTWTYGYVERYDLDYREINTEMENEITNNELSADNRMNRSHEIGRDSNGKAPLASVDNQIVRIPPYVLQHLSTPDTTKHDDGTTKYKDLLNNKYTATGYKGTQETGIYNTYNIKDTEFQAVHYRSGV
ncbi:InlB B-repeat-containing protein [Agathobacter rectalis]|uniref:Bacterial repeat domain-containing protein n=1 Tax=Agathobacter rectalis TaxID=39491 RepID=A0A3E4YC20_9FIRM|nr:InlB B-repeat-containing protein [Agathobacter rectalis]RGM72218.1 hypothetical protein DXB99_06715 [Agathobacter rectalis]